jgi:hypothetical protein
MTWGRAYGLLKVATAGVCAYEAVTIALDDDRAPTVSKLCGRHRWLAPFILTSLAVHLYWR